MSVESSYRREIVKRLESYSAFAVENLASPGTPDILCVLGGVEVKVGWWVNRNILRLRHSVQPAQRAWHARWAMSGGNSIIAVRVINNREHAVETVVFPGLLSHCIEPVDGSPTVQAAISARIIGPGDGVFYSEAIKNSLNFCREFRSNGGYCVPCPA